MNNTIKKREPVNLSHIAADKIVSHALHISCKRDYFMYGGIANKLFIEFLQNIKQSISFE